MRIFSTLVLVGLLVILPACNTVQGLGRDVQSVGKTVSDAAR